MKNKAVSGIMLTLLLTSMLALAFNIQSVRASGTIYIRADGSIEGTTHISTVDNITYTFTDNIYDSIVVERDNIVVDGAGYTLHGLGFLPVGIELRAHNITTKDMKIKSFYRGIFSYASNIIISRNDITVIHIGITIRSGTNITVSGNNITGCGLLGIFFCDVDPLPQNNTISGNKITNNNYGIGLHGSNNTVSGNKITNNWGNGIEISSFAHYNTISGNKITNNEYGIEIEGSNNTVSGNKITNNNRGIKMRANYSLDNKIYHNNIVDNAYQVVEHHGTMNIWDDGYPSGGNYWSDHVTVDDCCGVNQDEPGSDGIVDEPYVIDDYNCDNYPLVEPWSPVVSAAVDVDPDTLNLGSKGQWITAYIQLPEEYDAEDIDAATILLNETISPVLDPMYDFVTNSSEYLVDHNEDGILERMVKFDKAEVMALLSVGEAILTLTGEVDGTPFEGSDCIRVISSSTGSGGFKGLRK